jgi:protein-arginine kinase activator protein McsA
MSEPFYIIDQFGPSDAVKLIARRFCNFDALTDFDPKTLKDPRDKLSYGQNEAKKQWAIALRENEPDPDTEDCFICEQPHSKSEHWSSPQVEHLLPSAFAFLLFGLPGKFHLKWRDDKEESSRIIYNTAVQFGELMKGLQVNNYKWCHAYCNSIKRDSIFVKIVKATKGCLGSTSDPCEVNIYSGRDIIINKPSVEKFTSKLFNSTSDSGRAWKQNYTGDSDDISLNIGASFIDLINKLRGYDEDTIMAMIKFNLYVGLSIVYKYLGKPIPLSRANRMKGIQDDIKLSIENGGIMEGGGKEYLKEKLTKEEFEDFLKIGDAIKHYADLPYPGKDIDDAFVAEYVVTHPGQEDPVNIRTLELVPGVNVNNMNNGQMTPVKGKRSRVNNIPNNVNLYPVKKRPFTFRLPPGRSVRPGLMQRAGKYRKTRKNKRK